MNFYKILLPFLGIILITLQSPAKPAMQGIRIVNQPDGTELKIKVVGDERLHFVTTEDGKILHMDDNGVYTLGKIAPEGYIVSTGISPFDSNADKYAVSLSDINIKELTDIRKKKRGARQTGYGLTNSSYPTTGSPKGLIILVEYSDVKFHSEENYDGTEYFNDMINGENFTQNGGTGSALQYFKEQSGGLFVPEFDVLGPVTLPNNQSYYGRNDWYGNDQNAHQMVVHAIDILDETVDFSQYDIDNDGVLDNVYIFYAGQGEADYGGSSTVWPHSWDLREAGVNKIVDGVKVGHYACSNEWDKTTPTGVGTFIHEFSHVLGLPDLYHTVNSGIDCTPLDYSVLDYGPYNNQGRTPPNYGAFELNALGWREPIMLDEPASVVLENISSGQFGLIPTGKDTEFFLLENRQLEGWDTYIPNHGLLIWHIDYVPVVFMSNTVNNYTTHQYVDIVEANNQPGRQTKDGYTFPGTTGKTSFTSTTQPALKAWDGSEIDLPITDITENNGLISFDVAGGAITLSAPSPFVTDSSAAERYFVIDWMPVEGATDYFVTVYPDIETGTEEIYNGFDNSFIGEGWTATLEDWYTTNTNYGEASPSYKFKSTGQTLTSPLMEGDITEFRFWLKGQGSIDTRLIITGFTGMGWTQIVSIEPESNKTENITLDNIVEGVRQIRITMEKNFGNIAVDDMVIVCGGKPEALPDYDKVPTDNSTFYIVDQLIDGLNDYYFTVTSTDGVRTRVSDPVYVTLFEKPISTWINPVDMENSPAVYYNPQGIKIDCPVQGSLLIEVKGNKTRKVIIK